MDSKFFESYRDPKLAQKLVQQIEKACQKELRIMEVCGTHTVSIFRSGVRSLLPSFLSLVSGPGCPVCVTDQRDIDGFIALSRQEKTTITTFGDLMRVPGTESSLFEERAKGADVRMVYSPLDAVKIARETPDQQVVFLGVGFETTAPTIAAAIIAAQREKLTNFFIYSAHKLVPPALNALMGIEDVQIDGFLLPGHVSVIIGAKAYQPFVEKFRVPAVIAGFEPVDLLTAISRLVSQLEKGEVRLENAYPRAVTDEGNPTAQKLLSDVFEVADTEWRGLGTMPESGLKLKQAFEMFDAEKIFSIKVPKTTASKGCCCGEILTGRKTPSDCPLYGKACIPMHPVGPCMVSSEGTCAAFYRYGGDMQIDI
jgi:hydrogenase expression/formation protein HypD